MLDILSHLVIRISVAVALLIVFNKVVEVTADAVEERLLAHSYGVSPYDDN